MCDARFRIADANAMRPRGLRKRAESEKAENARRMRKTPTEAEEILWTRLRSRQCDGFKFRRKAVALGWIADFYCPEVRLIIEIDGGYQDPRAEEDRRRDDVMCAAGLSVLRVSDAMVISDIEGAVGQVKLAIAQVRGAVQHVVGAERHAASRARLRSTAASDDSGERIAEIDDHGQPLIRTFNAARLNDRMIDELIGLCRGVLFDGSVSELEANSLLRWMDANREISEHWPASILYRRVARMMSDQHLDPAEQRELIETLMEITGAPAPDASVKSGSTGLPLCSPLPVVSFPSKRFCFTGKFVSGTRRQVQAAVIALGADVENSPTNETNYLVIGSIGSTDWIHSTHGRKIEKAVRLRTEGKPIHIIAEEYWAQCIEAVVQQTGALGPPRRA
mgnify:CR=1 FL=1